MIDKTAIISADAKIHESVTVGPFSIIEGDVEIGEGTTIGSHVLIADGARLGKNVRIFQGAVIGSIPQDLKFEGEDSLVVIGDSTTIREYATINRGTKESGSTDVGKDCLIMSYAHVAHDCKLGDGIIMANSVNLAGHVIIEDYAIIGGIVPVHQFVRIGAHCMIGGGFRVPQDVAPFCLAGGYPLKVAGLNLICLRRKKFPREAIGHLQETFKLLFFSNLNTKQAMVRIKDEVELSPEVAQVIAFVEKSTRGIMK